MVNKFHYIKGGSETYYFSLKRILETQGHNVVDFSMKHEKNFDSPYKDYFVENVNYECAQSMLCKLRIASNIIYSFEAKKKFEALVKKEKPDIIHLHIFQHQISPSILDVAKKYRIPTVYTAHDLKALCLNYKMMHHGVICEQCKGEHYYRCAVNKCVKNSFLKSSLNVLEGYVHKWRKSYDAIDSIITPSAFYKKKFQEFGFAEDRVDHIPNFLDKQKPQINLIEGSKEYYLYFGRLSEEKGIITLIKAFKDIGSKLFIVGTGPLQSELLSFVNGQNLKNIVFHGFKSGQELVDLVGNAKAVILSSEWYENGPYSAIEALQLGRPIIGSDIGGIPELINQNGFLFKSASVDDLKKAVNKMEELSKEEYSEMEKASLALFSNSYTSQTHIEALQKVYEKAIKNKE